MPDPRIPKRWASPVAMTCTSGPGQGATDAMEKLAKLKFSDCSLDRSFYYSRGKDDSETPRARGICHCYLEALAKSCSGNKEN